MNWRLGDVSDVGRFGVTVYAVRVPHCLRSVGVFVIVVGNYFVAAFYEASGASACRIGFHIPVETSAPPKSACVCMPFVICCLITAYVIFGK